MMLMLIVVIKLVKISDQQVCVCGEFDWQTWGHIQKQVDVNFVGTLRVTKFCLPLLKAGEGEWCQIWQP